MSLSEMRQKTVEELSAILQEFLKKGFDYRMLQASDQLTQTHLFRENRRNIARIKTILSEMSVK